MRLNEACRHAGRLKFLGRGPMLPAQYIVPVRRVRWMYGG